MSAAALLADLVQCLHEESDALAAGDTGRLDDLSARKGDLMARLAPQLRSAGGTTSAERMHLRRAQQLNERNAGLLAVQWQATRSRAEALLTANRSGTLYDADGTVAAAGRPTLTRASA
jgi:flagellar biosynthesis/type III secretory pathway chaperone